MALWKSTRAREYAGCQARVNPIPPPRQQRRQHRGAVVARAFPAQSALERGTALARDRNPPLIQLKRGRPRIVVYLDQYPVRN